MQLFNILICKRAGLALLLFLAVLAGPALGQHHELGIGLGAYCYKGDLNPGFTPPLFRPGIQGYYKYNFSYVTALRANASYGRLRGIGKQSPNLYIAQVQPNQFSTSVTEVTGIFEYNFFNFRDPKYIRQRGSPYFLAGLGFFVFNPGDGEGNKRASAIQPVLPFGVGYKYRLSKNLNLAAEFGARKTFTDLLDDVSTQEGQPTFLQRGYRFDTDWYMFTGITLSYVFYTVVCPFDYN